MFRSSPLLSAVVGSRHRSAHSSPSHTAVQQRQSEAQRAKDNGAKPLPDANEKQKEGFLDFDMQHESISVLGNVM